MNRNTQWIALERAEGIGSASISEIYETLTSLSLNINDLFSLSEREIREEFSFKESIIKGIISAIKISDEIEDDCADMEEVGIKPLFVFNKDYPEILKQRLGNSAPPVLYLMGSPMILNETLAAVLAHSETSEKGSMIIFKGAKILSSHSITTVGNMSKGGGSILHRSTIEAGGKTIGILPCGFFTYTMTEKIQSIYNPDNFLIISPFYLKEEFNIYRAIERNKLICALSKAVFIVESPAKDEGGIFEAAKSAQKMHIPLFTAEYAEYSEPSMGNPVLIKEYGAQPVRGRKDENGVSPNLDAYIAKIKFN
ncbi:MAG: DNA-processing protein DprA [Spirochaetes bacterium]|nr:DNA-processing protein DprA [Spirochaetota bacterium]MBP9021968.1 DNA-processing protein DprA [Spirochaetota bacterium]